MSLLPVQHKAINWFNTDFFPDSKVHGANMGPIWGRQDPGGPMLAPWTELPIGSLATNISEMYKMPNFFERNVFEIILFKMLASQARTACADIGFTKFQLNWKKYTNFLWRKRIWKYSH